jgi:hypothetical protein
VSGITRHEFTYFNVDYFRRRLTFHCVQNFYVVLTPSFIFVISCKSERNKARKGHSVSQTDKCCVCDVFNESLSQTLSRIWREISTTILIYFSGHIGVCLNWRTLRGETRSRGSSVSVVPDYGLDDRAIEVQSPAEARGLFL